MMSGHKEHALEVPFDPAAEWSAAAITFAPGRRGVPVEARLNGRSFPSHVVARSRRFWLLVDSEVAKLASVGPGDTVSVVIGPAPAVRF
jgi:hypothetical protein